MNAIITGTRHEGKSTLSLHLARQFADTVVIWDPRGTFSAVGIECHDVDELFDALEEKIYLRTGGGKGKPLPLVLRMEDIGPDDFGHAMSRVFPAYFTFRGKIAVIVDEARTLQSPHWIEKQLDRLVRQAPPSRVMVIQNTHQLMDWNSATKSVIDDLYIFRQVGPGNHKAVTAHVGSDAADIAEVLPLHHLIHAWFDNRGTNQAYEIWDDPSVWYERISGESNDRAEALPSVREAAGTRS